MKTPDYPYLFLCITIALATLLSGCMPSDVKIGEARIRMFGADKGRISYDFSNFTGFESGSIQAKTGQIISLDYETAINEGSLIIEWQDPNGGIVWRKNLVKSEVGYDEIISQPSGTYTITIQGKDASGQFDVSWKIK